MENLKLEQIKLIIEKGDFEALVGFTENEFFECKQAIYKLDTESIKRELAKDVSSFANFNGGYILIGPKTKKSDLHLGDEISDISYLDPELVKIKDYQDVIKEWIYPEIAGLEISWEPSKDYRGKGILIIYIPFQEPHAKPYLIKKLVEGRKNSEIIFGFAERKRDSSQPKDVVSIHTLLRDGMTFSENIDGRLSAIENLLRQQTQQKGSSKKDEYYKSVPEKISGALAVSEIDVLPNFNLIAFPAEPIELNNIFQNTDIRSLLENPPEFRHMGWGLSTSNRAQIIEAKMWRVHESRKIIDLYRDGTLVFCSLIKDNLSWGMKNDLKLNCLALIESVTSFFSFYKELIKHFQVPVESIMTQYNFNNLWVGEKENKVFLNPGALNTHGFIEQRFSKYAPKPTYSSEMITFDSAKFNYLEISYKIIESIYTWFGIEPRDFQIPYVIEKDGVLNIDIERIKLIGKQG